LNTENEVEFIKRGLIFEPTKKTYRFYAKSQPAYIVLSLLGFAMGGYYKVFSILMIALNIACCVVLYVLSANPEKTRNRLIMTMIVCTSIVCNYSLCAIMLYMYFWGADMLLFILFLPSVIFSVITFVNNYIRINRKDTIKKRQVAIGKVGVGLSSSALAGVGLGKIWADDLSQNQVVWLVIIIFALLGNALSGYFTATVMRVYYFHKLQKKGLIENEFNNV